MDWSFERCFFCCCFTFCDGVEIPYYLVYTLGMNTYFVVERFLFSGNLPSDKILLTTIKFTINI